MELTTVSRINWGSFVRPAAETGTSAPRIEPVLGYVVRTGGRVVLVDTGIGDAGEDTDAWYRPLRKPTAEVLASVGLRTDERDVVINCRLHFDHVGAKPDSPGVPIVCQRREFEAAHRPGYTAPHLIDLDGATTNCSMESSKSSRESTSFRRLVTFLDISRRSALRGWHGRGRRSVPRHGLRLRSRRARRAPPAEGTRLRFQRPSMAQRRSTSGPRTRLLRPWQRDLDTDVIAWREPQLVLTVLILEATGGACVGTCEPKRCSGSERVRRLCGGCGGLERAACPLSEDALIGSLS